MIWMLLLTFTAIVLTLILFMPLRYTAKLHNQTLKSQIFKIIPTTLAAVCALVSCCRNGWTDAYGLWIFIGLTLCIPADFLLDYVLTAGGALFFFAHASYVLGMSHYSTPGPWSLAVGCLCWIGLLIFAGKYAKKVPNLPWHLKAGFFMYSLALGALLGFGLPQPFLNFTPRSVMAAVGAVLFVTSDLMLAKNHALKRGHQYQFLSLAIYYLAQFVLAMSTWPA